MLPSELRKDSSDLQNDKNAAVSGEPEDGEKVISGAIFAAAQANTALQDMLTSGASPSLIENMRSKAFHAAQAADKERERILDASLKKKLRLQSFRAAQKPSLLYTTMDRRCCLLCPRIVPLQHSIRPPLLFLLLLLT